MTFEPDYKDAAGNAITKEQAERQAMVDDARRFGEAQRRSERVMSDLQDSPDLASMVPDAWKHNPQAYLSRMADIGQDTVSPRVVDSASAGSLPVDRNILKGARNGPFECQPGAIRGDSIVSYRPFPNAEAITMRVDDAVLAGLLEPNGKGGFQVPGADDVAARAQDDQQEQAEAKRQFEAELEAKRLSGDEPDAALQQAINTAVSRVSAHATSALVEDAIANGDLSAAAVAQVSRAAGLTEQQGANLAQAMWDGFARQAAAAVTSAGVAPSEVDAVWAYASEHYATDLKNGVRNMALMSDVSAFKSIAKRYLAWRSAQIK